MHAIRGKCQSTFDEPNRKLSLAFSGSLNRNETDDDECRDTTDNRRRTGENTDGQPCERDGQRVEQQLGRLRRRARDSSFDRRNAAKSDDGEQDLYSKVVSRHENHQNVYTEYFKKTFRQGSTSGRAENITSKPKQIKGRIFKANSQQDVKAVTPLVGADTLNEFISKRKLETECPKNEKTVYIFDSHRDTEVESHDNGHSSTKKIRKRKEFIINSDYKLNDQYLTNGNHQNKKHLHMDQPNIKYPCKIVKNAIDMPSSNDVILKINISKATFKESEYIERKNMKFETDLNSNIDKLENQGLATNLYPCKGLYMKIFNHKSSEMEGLTDIGFSNGLIAKSSVNIVNSLRNKFGILPNTNMVIYDMYKVQKNKPKTEVKPTTLNKIKDEIEKKSGGNNDKEKNYNFVLDQKILEDLNDQNIQLQPAGHQKNVKTLKLSKLKNITKERYRIPDNEHSTKKILLKNENNYVDTLNDVFNSANYEDVNCASLKSKRLLCKDKISKYLNLGAKIPQFKNYPVAEQLLKNRKKRLKSRVNPKLDSYLLKRDDEGYYVNKRRTGNISTVMQAHHHAKESDLGAVLMVLPRHDHQDDLAEEYMNLGALEEKDSCHCDGAAGVEWFEIDEIQDEEDMFSEEPKPSTESIQMDNNERFDMMNYPNLRLKRTESIMCVDRKCSKSLKTNVQSAQPNVDLSTRFERKDSPFRGYAHSQKDTSSKNIDVVQSIGCGINALCRQPLPRKCHRNNESYSPYAQSLRKKPILKCTPCEQPRSINCTPQRKHHDPCKNKRAVFPEPCYKKPFHLSNLTSSIKKPNLAPEYHCDYGHHVGYNDSYSDFMFIPKNQRCGSKTPCSFRHSNHKRNLHSSSRTNYKPPLIQSCSRQEIYCRKHHGRDHSRHSHHLNHELPHVSHAIEPIPSQGCRNMCQYTWPDSQTSVCRIVPRRSDSTCRHYLGERIHTHDFDRTYLHDLRDGYYLDRYWIESNRQNEDRNEYIKTRHKHHEKLKKDHRYCNSRYGSMISVNTLSIQIDANDATPTAKPKMKEHGQSYMIQKPNPDKSVMLEIDINTKQASDNLCISEKQIKSINHSKNEIILLPSLGDKNSPDDLFKYNLDHQIRGDLANKMIVTNKKLDSNVSNEKTPILSKFTNNIKYNFHKHKDTTEIRSIADKICTLNKNGQEMKRCKVKSQQKISKAGNSFARMSSSSRFIISSRHIFSQCNEALRLDNVKSLKVTKRKFDDQTTQSNVELASSETGDECEITLTDLTSSENSEDSNTYTGCDETSSSDRKRKSLSNSRSSQSHMDQILKEFKIFDDTQCRYDEINTSDISNAHEPDVTNIFNGSKINEEKEPLKRVVMNHIKKNLTSNNSSISKFRKSKICKVIFKKSLYLDRYLSKPSHTTELIDIRSELGTREVCLSPCYYTSYEKKCEQATIMISGDSAKELSYGQPIKIDAQNGECTEHCKKVLADTCLEKHAYDNFFLENITSRIPRDNKGQDDENTLKVNKKRKHWRLQCKREDYNQLPCVDFSHRQSKLANSLESKNKKSNDVMSDDCKILLEIFMNIFEQFNMTPCCKCRSKTVQEKADCLPTKSNAKFWQHSTNKPNCADQKSQHSTGNLPPDCGKLLELLSQIYCQNDSKGRTRKCLKLTKSKSKDNLLKCIIRIASKCRIQEKCPKKNKIEPKHCGYNISKQLINKQTNIKNKAKLLIENYHLKYAVSSKEIKIKSSGQDVSKSYDKYLLLSLDCHNENVIKSLICNDSESNVRHESNKNSKHQANRLKKAIRKYKSITAAKLKGSCKTLYSSKSKKKGRLSRHSLKDSLCKIRESIRSKINQKVSVKKPSRKNVSFSNVTDSITICDTTNSIHRQSNKSFDSTYDGICGRAMKPLSKTSIIEILTNKEEYGPKQKLNSIRISNSCPNYRSMVVNNQNPDEISTKVVKLSSVLGDASTPIVTPVKSKRNLKITRENVRKPTIENKTFKHSKSNNKEKRNAEVSIFDKYNKKMAVNRCISDTEHLNIQDIRNFNTESISKKVAFRPVFYQGIPTNNVLVKKSTSEILQKVGRSIDVEKQETCNMYNDTKITEESHSTELVTFCYTSASSIDRSNSDDYKMEHKKQNSLIDQYSPVNSSYFLTRVNSLSTSGSIYSGDFEHFKSGQDYDQSKPNIEGNLRNIYMKSLESRTHKIYRRKIYGVATGNTINEHMVDDAFVNDHMKRSDSIIDSNSIIKKVKHSLVHDSNDNTFGINDVKFTKTNNFDKPQIESYKLSEKLPRKHDKIDYRILRQFSDNNSCKNSKGHESVELTVLNSEAIQASSGKVNFSTSGEHKMIILCSEDQQT